MTAASLFRAVAATCALAATGAGGAPFADPLAAAPAALKVSLTLPPGFGVLPGSAALHVQARNDLTGETVTATDGLAVLGAPGEMAEMELATPAAAELSRLETTVAAWRAAKANPVAQISVTFTPCRLHDGADPAGPIDMTLRLASGGPRFALVQPGTTLAGFLNATAPAIADCPS
jgi:hypothetical protein